jgi:hypothetical protein
MAETQRLQKKPKPWSEVESEMAQPVPEHDANDHVQNRYGGRERSVEIPQVVCGGAVHDEDRDDRRYDEDRDERQNPHERPSIVQVRAYASRFASQVRTQPR